MTVGLGTVVIIVALAVCAMILQYYFVKFSFEVRARKTLNQVLPEEMPFGPEPVAAPPVTGRDEKLDLIYDKMIERLDERLARMKKLIEKADFDIVRLESLDGGRRIDVRGVEAPEPARSSRYARDPYPDSRPSRARESEETIRPHQPPASEGSRGGRYRRIYELRDRGMEVIDIARAVGVGIGEVELVLNLRERRREGL